MSRLETSGFTARLLAHTQQPYPLIAQKLHVAASYRLSDMVIAIYMTNGHIYKT
jgi:hypothetical protein